MLKTIKTVEKMRLDQLIKYCIDNEIEDRSFQIGDKTNLNLTGNTMFNVDTSNYKEFRVSGSGNFKITGYINKNDLFEVEEEITKDTVFDFLISVDNDGAIYNEYKKSIGFVLSKTSGVVQILAYVNGRYRTVWEREAE